MPPCMELSERLEREGKGGSSEGEAGTEMIVWVFTYLFIYLFICLFIYLFI